jgi:RimJ/RimL family protein N-acetyltransferase
MLSIPDLIQPLRDGEVRVRFAAERDIPEILIAYQDDPQLHLALGLQRPPSGAELGQGIERAAAERAAGIHAQLTILAPGSDDFCGQIDLQGIDWEHARAELGIWLAPAARGRGLGASALALAARWALTACGLERVEMLTEAGNQAMTAAARGAGFVFEGSLRGYLREHGRRVDCAVLSLIKSDLVASS